MFWINISRKLLRFGIDEFALITGLKCTGDFDKSRVRGAGGGLLQRCFDGAEYVDRKAIFECFERRRWSNDNDAIRIAVLYFIHSFLMSHSSLEKTIPSFHISLVDSGLFAIYTWGKDVFNATI